MAWKILVFCWVVRLEKILTMDNLRKRNIVIVNGCPLCLANEETVVYLFIHCGYATSVWGFIWYALGNAENNFRTVPSMEDQRRYTSP